MLRLVLCLALVVLAMAADRPSLNSNGKKFKVQRQEDVYVSDMDRLAFDGVYDTESSSPQALYENVDQDALVSILEASLGENWRDLVDYDDSQPITHLELLRLTASISAYNVEQEANSLARGGRANLCWCHGTAHSPLNSPSGVKGGQPYKGVRITHPGNGHLMGTTGHKVPENGTPYESPRDCLLCLDQSNCVSHSCCSGLCTADGALDVTPLNAFGMLECDLEANYDIGGVTVYPNDISACNVEDPDECSDFLDFCDCNGRLWALEEAGCDCADVVTFCDTCFQAWSAIDHWKNCDCYDYAMIFQSEGTTEEFGEFR